MLETRKGINIFLKLKDLLSCLQAHAAAQELNWIRTKWDERDFWTGRLLKVHSNMEWKMMEQDEAGMVETMYQAWHT